MPRCGGLIAVGLFGRWPVDRTLSVSATNLCGTTTSSSLDVSITGEGDTAQAGNDVTVLEGEIIELQANTPASGDGQWQVVSGPQTSTGQFGDTTSAQTSFTPGGGPGSYVLRWMKNH